jgi:RNA polymerase sigma-70 factor (ECF subfamily)
LSRDSPPHADANFARRFATTQWSLVLAAGDRGSPEAQEALAILCETYWAPLYAFVRRQGFDEHQSQDLTQEFFAQLLDKEFLRAVVPGKGKFRTFLLIAVKHFLANERDRARAQKRGGGRSLHGLDFDQAERTYSLEPYHTLTPEKHFDRRWAVTLLNQVVVQLRDESIQGGRAQLFEMLKGFLSGEGATVSYAEAAAALNMSEGAVRVAVHRLRARYRDLLRAQIGRTVNHPSEIDSEIRELFAAFQ